MKPIKTLKQKDAKQTGFFKTSTKFRFLFSIIIFGLALAILLPAGLAVAENITINSPTNTTYPTSYIVFNATTNATSSWCGYSLDNVANVTMTNSSKTFWYNSTPTTVVDGYHNVTVSCNDTAGNKMNTSLPRYFTVDTSLPTITITSPANTTYASHNITLSYTATSTGTIDKCWYNIDNGASNNTLTNCGNTTFLVSTDGSHTVIVYANSTTGAISSSQQWFSADIKPPQAFLGSNMYNESGLFIGGADVGFGGYVNDTGAGASGLKNWSISLYDLNGTLIRSNICLNETGDPINGPLCTWDTTTDCPPEAECGNFTANLTVYDKAGNKNDSTVFPVHIDNIYPVIDEIASFTFHRDGNFWRAEFGTSDNRLARVRGYTLDSTDSVVIGQGFLCNETQGNQCNRPGSGTFKYDWHLDSYTLNSDLASAYYNFNFGYNESPDWHPVTIPGCIAFNGADYDCGQAFDNCTDPPVCDNITKQYRWWVVYNMSDTGILAGNGTPLGITQENFCNESGCIINNTLIQTGVTRFIPQADHYLGSNIWTSTNLTEIVFSDIGSWLNINLTRVASTGNYSFLIQSNDYSWTTDSPWGDAFVGDVCGNGIKTCECGDTVYNDYTLEGPLDCSSKGNALIIGAGDITIDCAGNSITGDDSGDYAGFIVANSGITIKNCSILSFGTGIAAVFSNDSHFYDNTIDLGDGGISGIFILNSSGDTIENNTISDTSLAISSDGIFIQGTLTSNHHITNNTIVCGEGVECFGIEVLAEDNDFIQYNHITSDYIGIGALNSNNMVITSNNVSIIGFVGGSISSLSGLSIADIESKYKSDSKNWNINGISINAPTPITGIFIGATDSEIGGDNLIGGNTILGFDLGIASSTERNTLAGNVIDCSGGTTPVGVFLVGSDTDIIPENNFLFGNDVSDCLFGLFADGSDYSLANFTINGDAYHDNTALGIWLNTVGTPDVRPTITNSKIYYNLAEGIDLSASWANIANSEIYSNIGDGMTLGATSIAFIANTSFYDNLAALSGLGVGADSIAVIEDSNFINNTEYGIDADGYIDWTIVHNAICKDNKLLIPLGEITFDGGVLIMDNCSLSMYGGTPLNFTANITSLDVFPNEPITANTSKELNFISSPLTNITLYLTNDTATTIAVSGLNPASAPTGLTGVTGISVEVDDNTEGNLTWALIKIFYNETEVSNAGIDESSLEMYFYNATVPAWQLEPDQGVDTSNNYIWARVAHLSVFGVFGSISTTTPGGQTYSTEGGTAGIKTVTPAPTLPAAVQPATPTCTPNWNCTASTKCINGTMTRTCTDLNNCGTIAGKPVEETSCITGLSQQNIAIIIIAIVAIAVAATLLRRKKR